MISLSAHPSASKLKNDGEIEFAEFGKKLKIDV